MLYLDNAKATGSISGWARLGRLWWRRAHVASLDGSRPGDQVGAEMGQQNDSHYLLQAGFFGRSVKRAMELHEALVDLQKSAPLGW